MANGQPDFLMTFPLPPSQNQAVGITSIGGRAKMYNRKCVEEWQAKCYELLEANQPERIKLEPVFLFVTFYKHTKARYDIDNLFKKLQDLMSGIVYTDDSYIVSVFTAKKPCLKGDDRCTVAVYRRSTNGELYELLDKLQTQCVTKEGYKP